MSGLYAYTPYIWPMLAVAIVAASVSAYSLHWRAKPGALALALTCMFACVWAMGCVLEIAAVDTSTRIFWSGFQGPWKLATATAEFCFVLEYADPGRWLNRRTLALLSFPVLVQFLLAVTNNAHHLIFWGFTDDAYPRPVPGIANVLMAVYTLLVLSVLQLVILVWLAVRSPQHRVPVALMVIGQVSVRVATFLDWSGSSRLAPMDVGLVFAAALFLLYAFILSRFHLFDLVPVARAIGIEQMDAGLVVLDAQRRIVDLNPAAERILGVSLRQLHGQSVQALPLYADLQARPDNGERLPSEIVIGAGSDARYYTLAVNRLTDRRGVLLGQNVLLYDVTEQKRARKLVEQQQRALAALQERERLARELHDSMGQVYAFINTQGQTIRRLLARGEIAKVDDYVAQIIDAAREADMDIRESIVGLRVALSAQGFFPALDQYLQRYEKNYNIHTELVRPETLGNDAFEPEVEAQLLRILQEALTNARKHANAHGVRVTFTVENGGARVAVQDDGQGFDPEKLSDGFGHGFGLRFMRERAQEVGGDVTINSEPGHGTQVAVQVPLGASQRRS